MPLFGFRTDKKHGQSHIQAEAGLAKSAVPAVKKTNARGPKKGARMAVSAKPEKISAAVITKDSAGAAKSAPALPSGHFSIVTQVIIRPHITEKSGILSQNGVYTFQVTKNADKQSVSKAIAELYKVTPVKIAMINTSAKNIIHRGRKGSVSGIKKAVVTVKKGDKIDFV